MAQLTIEGAFDQIEPHVARLLSPSRDRKALAFFTTGRDRAFILQNDAGDLDLTFLVEWREQPQEEAAIRSFFSSLGVAAWRDYLAGSATPDGQRILAYPLKGDAPEVASLVGRVLTELFGISANEPLLFQYSDGLS